MMKGDFTRTIFDTKKHYSSVRMQQGRVQTDADWNAREDIEAYLDRTTRRDVIGYCGGPQGQDAQGNDLAGFKIVVRNGELVITKGRYYVAGILCESEEDVPITNQPLLPGLTLPDRIGEEGVFLAYLDVWERHITALEDPEIREVALGGPDTTTRMQSIGQVKLEKVADGVDCKSFGPNWTPVDQVSSGRLAARAKPGSLEDDLCLTSEGAGYRGLENQLYRVEIHSPGSVDEATFVWARDNGTVVAAWEDQDGDDLIIGAEARDVRSGFAAGQWVELIDDTRELTGRPGVLAALASVDGRTLTIDPDQIADPDDPAATSVDIAQFDQNRAKIRRWDVPRGAEPVRVPAENDGWLPLEDGVEIHFEPNGRYQTGDYWLVPARTALADLLWPVDATSGEPIFGDREGIKHHYCPLALITPGGTSTRALVRLSDGQVEPDLATSFEASPDGRQWTFELASGVLRPDGSELTAAIIADIVEGSANIITGFDSVEAIDDFTLVINLSQPAVPDLFFAELSDIRIDVEAQKITDCRSLFPPLTGLDLTTSSQPPEPAIHVVEVVFSNGEPLDNDTEFPAPLLANGLEIRCDGPIDPLSIKGKPTCYVTLDIPFPFNQSDRGIWGAAILGTTPLKLAAETTAQGEVIIWRPLGPVAELLGGRLFQEMERFGRRDRILAHLALKGNFIWSPDTPRLFLDGEAFGGRRLNASNTELSLPSGDGLRGGDFEMWFVLTP